jgi:hypothetical protein
MVVTSLGVKGMPSIMGTVVLGASGAMVMRSD